MDGNTDGHRRNILIIAATIVAIILLVGANIALILARPDTTEDHASPTRTGEPGTSASTPATKPARHQKPLEVCEKLAPKATAAYVGKDGDRDRLIRRYFVSDAQGLNIPASRIADQPDVQASGGMNAGTDTTATCSVWTGLESPWTLTWEWDSDKGWKCTGISGPLEGAYTTLGDKTPEEGGTGK